MRIASSALLLLAVVTPAPAEELNRIVLRVNSQVVTLADYTERRNARAEAIAQAPDLDAAERRQLIADSGKSALGELFEELLIVSRAEQLKMAPSAAEIDRAVDAARRRYNITSDEEFARALEQSGTSVAQFRVRMERSLLVNEVLGREIESRVKVDDETAARYWREHPAEFAVPERRQVEEAIVREGSGLAAEEQNRIAVAIRDAIVAGKSVADAVTEVGAGDNVLVLDHEWIEHGTLAAALETSVWELGAGGVAGPLPGRGGLHVLHLSAIEPASTRPLEEVRPEILARLRQAEFERESDAYLDELARVAFVVENVPPEAVGYRGARTLERDPLRALIRGPEKGAVSPQPADGESAPQAAPEASDNSTGKPA